MMEEKVTIIIITFNSEEYIEKNLSSILSQSYQNFDVIYFDNASVDNSAAAAEKYNDKRIKFVRSELNHGFAGANNIAVGYSQTDLIVLLNPDTYVEKDWLKHLVNAMSEKKMVASSFVKTEGIPEKYYESNGSVSYFMYNIMNVFPGNEDEFYPNGASLIFRKSEIGYPFDNDYFVYSEDLYLGLKARFMGMKIKFVKDSIVYHKGGASSKASTQLTFLQERNRYLNLYFFFSVSFVLKTYPLDLFVKSGKVISSLGNKKISTIGLIKAYVWLNMNIPYILRKRKEIKKIKIIDESNVIRFISSKLVNDKNLITSFINKTSYLYSRLMGIKPFEYYN